MKKLQVPENIPLRWEAWRGFGKPELIKTAVITVAATAAVGLGWTWTGSKGGMIAATMAAIFVFSFCVGLFSKLENNQSIYDFFLRRAAFRREQQDFYFKRREGAYTSEEAESKAVGGAGIC